MTSMFHPTPFSLLRLDAADTARAGLAPPAGIERRIRNPKLQRMYLRWRRSLLDDPGLPAAQSFSFDADGLSAHSFIAAVRTESFVFVSVGSALAERLGRPLVGEAVEGDAAELFGSQKATYRRCVEHKAPCYEFLGCNLGDGQPLLFERLVMPFFGEQSAVTHVGGAALFTTLAQPH
jgi:hypothetical protein